MNKGKKQKNFPSVETLLFMNLWIASHVSLRLEKQVLRLKTAVMKSNSLLWHAAGAGSDGSNGTHADSCTAAQTKQATVG